LTFSLTTFQATFSLSSLGSFLAESPVVSFLLLSCLYLSYPQLDDADTLACELDDEAADNGQDSEVAACPFLPCEAVEDNRRVHEEAGEDRTLVDNVRLLDPGALGMQVGEKAIQGFAPANPFLLVWAASAEAHQRQHAYYHLVAFHALFRALGNTKRAAAHLDTGTVASDALASFGCSSSVPRLFQLSDFRLWQHQLVRMQDLLYRPERLASTRQDIFLSIRPRN
jgi:hypothetical protein